MIKVDHKYIGKDAPCFIAAEIGINHNGDLDLAKQTIDAAKYAGVDAVKFQYFHTEDFLLDKELTHEYESQGEVISEAQYEMFKRCELNLQQLTQIKSHCDTLGILFFCTPTNIQGVHDLQELQSPLLKNGSDFLGHLDLIAEMAKTNIPTILSLGMATLDEIHDAVNTFEQAGGKDLILLHCVSVYPCPAEALNLSRIRTLIQTFKHHPIGFSDHSKGTQASVGAVALGACFLEKHFTLDKNLSGPDHSFSADPEEMKQLVDDIRSIESSLGSSEIAPAHQEEYARNHYRLSCVAGKDLLAGHILHKEDIAFARPAKGLPPKSINLLIDKALTQEVKKNQPLTLNLIK